MDLDQDVEEQPEMMTGTLEKWTSNQRVAGSNPIPDREIYWGIVLHHYHRARHLIPKLLQGVSVSK